jgi:phosphatidylglycerol:prolipoprotein diacylglycerol transferase
LHFSFYLTIGPLSLHPHWVFEALSYLVGARFYLWHKARQGDTLGDDDRWSIVAAAGVGAALGGKLVYLLSDPFLTAEHATDPLFLMGGKSIVGALVGALIAVEWVKRRIGVTRSSGDLFVVPLSLGIAVGRVGCFLTGLEDHTHGLPTDLPWAVDYGDGIPRHPAQLYEIGFLLLLTPIMLYLQRRQHREGDVFKLFMVIYMAFRFTLEFIKPGVFFGGLNLIQWVALGCLAYYAQLAVRARQNPGVALG